MTTAPHSDIATGLERLAGDELLAFMKGNESLSETQLCLGAGYVRYSDGIGYPQFTDFYTAILEARNIPMNDNTSSTQSGADWYDSLSDQDRELYDMIEDMCPEFEKLDATKCQEFMDELSELGITTADQFECAYLYQTDEYNAERAFAEYYVHDIACVDQFADAGMLSMIVIDYQETWDRNLSYDINTIEFDGETYFFQNL